jgi:hypothetical protein
MAVIPGLDKLAEILTNGTAQHPSCSIDSRVGAAAATATITGQFTSLWKYNKTNGANGANPPTGSGEAPTRATIGALKHTNAASGKELWLLGLEAVANVAGTLVFYDRLVHTRGLSGIVASAQAVNSVALTRNTSGEGVQAWVEIYTAVGATVTTMTISYTNQAGVAGRISPAFVFGGTNGREEGRLIRVPLADGDTGVQSVQSVTPLASTGTAGDFGITLAKRIANGFIEGPGSSCFRDFLTGIPAMITIPDNACLALGWVAGSVTPPRLDFTYHAAEN